MAMKQVSELPQDYTALWVRPFNQKIRDISSVVKQECLEFNSSASGRNGLNFSINGEHQTRFNKAFNEISSFAIGEMVRACKSMNLLPTFYIIHLEFSRAINDAIGIVKPYLNEVLIGNEMDKSTSMNNFEQVAKIDSDNLARVEFTHFIEGIKTGEKNESDNNKKTIITSVITSLITTFFTSIIIAFVNWLFHSHK